MAKTKNVVTPMSLPDEMLLVLPDPKGKKTVTYRALSPTPEQLAIFAADAVQSSLPVKLQAVLNLLEDVLEDPNEVAEIRMRLRDRNDVLDFKGLFEPIQEMFIEATGFPTESASGSSPSPSNTGRRSTGRVQPGE